MGSAWVIFQGHLSGSSSRVIFQDFQNMHLTFKLLSGDSLHLKAEIGILSSLVNLQKDLCKSPAEWTTSPHWLPSLPRLPRCQRCYTHHATFQINGLAKLWLAAMRVERLPQAPLSYLVFFDKLQHPTSSTNVNPMVKHVYSCIDLQTCWHIPTN